jgi:hypothetical protein
MSAARHGGARKERVGILQRQHSTGRSICLLLLDFGKTVLAAALFVLLLFYLVPIMFGG